MTGYMLDSNVVIDIVREPYGPVAAAFANLESSELAISTVVSGELRFGMLDRPEAKGNPLTSLLLRSLRIDMIETPADIIYGKLRAELKRQGRALSPNDYWIAAHALSRDAILVTGDRAFHDAKIDGLKLQDWRTHPAAQERN